MSLVADLQGIGLSNKEAKVYLASLEIGQASVQNISKKANVNRATTYSILDALIAKGLVSTFEKGKKTFFNATSPDYLSSMFEMRKKEVEEKQKHFQNMLPQLKLIHNQQEDKPVIRFYDGKQGLLTCVEEYITATTGEKDEPIRMIYNKDRLDELFDEDDLAWFRKKRLTRKIKSRVLYNSVKKELRSNHHGTRIKINSKEYPISSDIGIYGDYVRIASLGKRLSSVLIKDKEIAKTMKSIFELAWEASMTKDVDRKKEKRKK